MPVHIDPITRCHYRDSGGRRCRMPREKGHPSFCSRHASSAALARQQSGGSDSGIGAPGKGAVQVGIGAPGKGAVQVGNVAADLTPDLLGPINDFRTNTAINYTLGRLLILKAADQISARDAATMAYICQLLLQSVPGVRKEMRWSHGGGPEDADLRSVIDATSSLWDDAEAPAPIAAHK